MCTRKGEKMDSIIELIYDGIQESSLIQKERENSQKEVERIAEYIMSNRQLKQEELSDQLYGLVLIAEKEGFRAGCVCGAKVKQEFQLYDNKGQHE